MLNAIKEICKWQVDAGNASKPYTDELESAFQIEEALEGFNINQLAKEIKAKESSPKEVSRCIVHIASVGHPEPISDVERLDKACDSVVYAIGSMQKLGLDHHGITKALNIVNSANKQKLGADRDSAGKLGKPDNFVGPEAELQKLLDSYK